MTKCSSWVNKGNSVNSEWKLVFCYLCYKMTTRSHGESHLSSTALGSFFLKSEYEFVRVICAVDWSLQTQACN